MHGPPTAKALSEKIVNALRTSLDEDTQSLGHELYRLWGDLRVPEEERHRMQTRIFQCGDKNIITVNRVLLRSHLQDLKKHKDVTLELLGLIEKREQALARLALADDTPEVRQFLGLVAATSAQVTRRLREWQETRPFRMGSSEVDVPFSWRGMDYEGKMREDTSRYLHMVEAAELDIRRLIPQLPLRHLQQLQPPRPTSPHSVGMRTPEASAILMQGGQRSPQRPTVGPPPIPPLHRDFDRERALYEEYQVLKNKAAVRIQSIVRRKLACKTMAKLRFMELEASVIQRWWRAAQCRKRGKGLCKHIRAVQKIERFYRLYVRPHILERNREVIKRHPEVVKNWTHLLRRHRRLGPVEAAKVLQRFWKSKWLSCELKKRVKIRHAVTLIQRLWHRFAARKLRMQREYDAFLFSSDCIAPSLPQPSFGIEGSPLNTEKVILAPPEAFSSPMTLRSVVQTPEGPYEIKVDGTVDAPAPPLPPPPLPRPLPVPPVYTTIVKKVEKGETVYDTTEERPCGRVGTTWWRGDLLEAVQTLQRAARCWRARGEMAARRQQRARFLTQKEGLEARTGLSLTLSTFLRSHRSERLVTHMGRGVLRRAQNTIARSWRRYMTRKVPLNELTLEETLLCGEVEVAHYRRVRAMRIEEWYRGVREQQALREARRVTRRVRSTRRIQKWWRLHLLRSMGTKERQRQAEAYHQYITLRREAAEVIQHVWRGYRLRKRHTAHHVKVNRLRMVELLRRVPYEDHKYNRKFRAMFRQRNVEYAVRGAAARHACPYTLLLKTRGERGLDLVNRLRLGKNK